MAAPAEPISTIIAHRKVLSNHDRAPLLELQHNARSGARILVSSANDADTEVEKPSVSTDLLLPASLKLNATHLISSPYSDFSNQLDLQTLESPYKLFAFALTALKPIRGDYATAPYLESFNWSEVFALLRALCLEIGYRWQKLGFYTVIFRSTLQPGIDRERLGLLDKKSHEEACASGGLLKYWFGTCDDERRNLATCELRSMRFSTTAKHELQAYGAVVKMLEQAAAVHGMPRPELLQERCERSRCFILGLPLTINRYESITFHVHKLVVEDGATSWRLEEFR